MREPTHPRGRPPAHEALPGGGPPSQGPGLTFEVTGFDGSARVSLVGDLDLYSTVVMDDCVVAIGDLAPTVRLDLDLAGLEFCDVEGMRTLVQVHDLWVAQGVTVTLIHARSVVRRLFDVGGVSELLDKGA
jgi:anti-anti-sigma factor